MKNFALLLTLMLFLTCQEDDLEPASLGSVFGINDFSWGSEKMADYSIFATVANGGVFIRISTHIDNDGVETNGASLSASFLPDKSDRGNRIDAGDYFINDDKWVYQEIGYRPENAVDNLEDYVKPLFDSHIDFSLINDGQTIVTSSLLTPQRLMQFDVDDTQIIDPASSVRWINRSGISLNWNADETNENGVLLIMSSQRANFNDGPDAILGETVRATALMEDNGRFTLPDFFLDGIGQNEFITLTLYRGNFDYQENDGEGNDYKFYAMSEISSRFVVR